MSRIDKLFLMFDPLTFEVREIKEIFSDQNKAGLFEVLVILDHQTQKRRKLNYNGREWLFLYQQPRLKRLLIEWKSARQKRLERS